MLDSFSTHSTLTVGDDRYHIRSLAALEGQGWSLSRMPYALRILLENVLRNEDGAQVTAEDIEAVAAWDPADEPSQEVAYTPARVLLQDFTGVPAVVDLAAMRDAMARMGGDPKKINPLQPAELVIDHSVQVDVFGTPEALRLNAEKEFERNRERYAFLKWGQQAFDTLRVVPPDTGIIHQVNLEYLARVVMDAEDKEGQRWAYPDTLVGTDSHTTMINGLGVLGWGVGGIEAEAAMLGQPISMLVPQVVGFRLEGELREGVTATDLVLRVVEMLRELGVVGKFVEFFGAGLSRLGLADRAIIANMGPEYGATCGIFPVDQATLDYLRFTGRPPERVALVEAYMKEQGLFRTDETPDAEYSSVLELDLSTVEPSLAGPRRPQDRIALGDMKPRFRQELADSLLPAGASANGSVTATIGGETVEMNHGAVVIAAITSCTNTSNPSVLMAAGLLAKKAVERGLRTKPWVKTSLAPGSQVVTDYLTAAGLVPFLEELKFHVVGYGCTTCIGNSGPLPEEVSQAIRQGNLVTTSVLSGNRNFEGRVHAEVRGNYLASPPLVVAYALAGTVDIDLTEEPLGVGSDGEPVYLRDIWPAQAEVDQCIAEGVRSEMFRQRYGNVFAGDERWNAMEVTGGERYAWDPDSTYVRNPPFFDDMAAEPAPPADITGARVLALLGDSVTTDHISPAGSFAADSPAGKYLLERGVEPAAFNSYGSRRGNHEVMMRGTFANIRIRNQIVPGVEGGYTAHLPDGEQMTMFEAAMKYQEEGVPLLVIAGKEYGSGSSRDWAAKGPRLLGVRAVIAESYERIHRSNLIGMGIAPLQFRPGESAASLGLSGRETYSVTGLAEGIENGFANGRQVRVTAASEDSARIEFTVDVRIDTPAENDYYRHGGILQYVLRQLLHDA